MFTLQRSLMITTLLLVAACGEDPPGQSSTGDETVPAPHGPCFCDVDADGQQDPATCAAGQACGVVCPSGAVDCPPGAEQGASLCYTPCVEDTPACDCYPLEPPAVGGACFVFAACGG